MANSQRGEGGRGNYGSMKGMPAIGEISGKVIDSATNKPIAYATIALIDARKDSIVNGVVTNDRGIFFIEKIKSGSYLVEVTFLGYEKRQFGPFRVTPQNPSTDLGKIFLHPDNLILDEVVVRSDQSAISYQIDKKVIDASKILTAASGSAVDLLENVPSVRVDIEGNVFLRGSSGFTVLIDGKQSVLDPSDALRQIPSSSIKSIEIITNPSVKYDPDGTVGIINVITKRNSLRGMSGEVTLNGGTFGKYGFDGLINFRTRKINYSFGANYDVRNNPGIRESERITLMNDTLLFINSMGNTDRGFTRKSIKGGILIELSKRDELSAEFRMGRFEMETSEDLNYKEWKQPGTYLNEYVSLNNTKRGGNYYSINSTYTRKLNAKGHQIVGTFLMNRRDMDEISVNELFDKNYEIQKSGNRNTEKGPGQRVEFKVDYTLPLKEKNKFEAGLQTRLGSSSDETELFFYDSLNREYVLQNEFSNYTKYLRNIYGAYSLFNAYIGSFGYQIGLRGEYTNRNINTASDDSTYTFNRFDYFPSLHLSYNFPKDYQLMVSYSRRIQRPRSWYLEPFITWQDAYNVRQGNPDLIPEYTDAYELSAVKKLGRNFISFEGYYRVTHNKVERVISVYSDGVLLSTIKNVGKDFALGTELMFSYEITKWWKVDIMGNFYQYLIKGVLYDEDFSRSSFNWNIRWNNSFTVTDNTIIQLNSSYQSASVTAQGSSSGYFSSSFALRQNFLKKKLSAILQMRDIFHTIIRESESSGRDFENYSKRYLKSPIITLTVKYNFNNYKTARRNDSGGGDSDEF
jgi:outer membrane receptor protein involved in Fe transport